MVKRYPHGIVRCILLRTFIYALLLLRRSCTKKRELNYVENVNKDQNCNRLNFIFAHFFLENEYRMYTVFDKRRYRVCPIIHCCNSTTPHWITAPPILFYMVPCEEGHLCACNNLGKHQPLVKRNISFESYEWALFIEVALFTNGSGCPGTIVLRRCQKVMRTS